MAPDLTFLREPLPPGGESLASVDPRLTALDSLAKRGDWPGVAERVEELLRSGVYDVRALSYYVYAAFARGGLPALPEVLDAVRALLADHYAAVGPEAKRDHHFDRRLAWLFDEVAGSLHYHEVKRTPEWTAWNALPPLAGLEKALAIGTAIDTLMTERRFSTAPRALSVLLAWLRSQLDGLRPPLDAPSPSPASPEAPATTPEASASPAPAPSSQAPSWRLPGSTTLTLTVSERFLELAYELRAFEALVERKQFDRAAVIADDVTQRIAKFDPREYFPELFAPFSALLAKNVAPITERLQNRESAQWRALVQYLMVDLEGFAGEGE